MASTRLTLSCGDYDRTRPLIDGTVSTPGLDLTVIPLPSAERHTRFVTKLEFDVCELQIAQYLGLKNRGAAITAIPVFPHRRFIIAASWCTWTLASRGRKISGGGASAFKRISIRLRSGCVACCNTSSTFRQVRSTGSRMSPNPAIVIGIVMSTGMDGSRPP